VCSCNFAGPLENGALMMISHNNTCPGKHTLQVLQFIYGSRNPRMPAILAMASRRLVAKRKAKEVLKPLYCPIHFYALECRRSLGISR
jgi:hypothetical protein